MNKTGISEITLRAATLSDWPEVATLLTAAELPLAGVQEHFADFTVAAHDGVVGCIGLERYGAAGLLRSLAVSPSQRARGLGRALVDQCVLQARARGVRTLVLLTTSAEQYFARLGFTRVDRAAVPEQVFQSAEFRGACPSSAIAMTLDLWSGVRPARAQDAPAIAAIYNEGIRGRGATFETAERTDLDVAAWIGVLSCPLLVAEREGRVLGWARAFEYRSRAAYAGVREFSVYVAQVARGAGLGRVLLQSLIVECERQGHWKLLSRIFPENHASLALCRRLDFREVGVYQQHAQLDGEWRDVVIVERLIGRGAGS